MIAAFDRDAEVLGSKMQKHGELRPLFHRHLRLQSREIFVSMNLDELRLEIRRNEFEELLRGLSVRLGSDLSDPFAAVSTDGSDGIVFDPEAEIVSEDPYLLALPQRE
jgi:hypothetical protein